MDPITTTTHDDEEERRVDIPVSGDERVTRSTGKAPRAGSALKEGRRKADPLGKESRGRVSGPASARKKREEAPGTTSGAARGEESGGGETPSTSAGPSRAASPASSCCRDEYHRCHVILTKLDDAAKDVIDPDEEMESARSAGSTRSARSARLARSPSAPVGGRRGGPLTATDYIGLADAKRLLQVVEREEVSARLEREVTAHLIGAIRLLPSSGEGTVADFSVVTLREAIEGAAKAVERVSTVSKGLKGTLQRSLKEAAATVRVTAEELGRRAYAGTATSPPDGAPASADEHARRLKELEREVASLRMENDLLRKTAPPPPPHAAAPRPLPRGVPRVRGSTVEDPPAETMEVSAEGAILMPPPPPPPLTWEERNARREKSREASLARRLEGLIEAKFEALMARMAPEKGVKRGISGGSVGPNQSLTPGPTRANALAPSQSSRPSRGTGRDGEGKKGGTAPRKGVPAKGGKNSPPTAVTRASTAPASRVATTTTETWVEVVKRGKRAKATNRQKPSPSAPTPRKTPPAQQKVGKAGAEVRKTPPLPSTAPPQPKPRRLPRTEAVTLTCPEGRYSQTMGKARRSLDPKALGITGGFHMRRTQTGALALELSGAGRVEKANQAAAKLREIFAGEEGVKVARPMSRAEVRVHGLDDSVTARDITLAIASAGGCSEADVQAAPVTKAGSGLGTAWVRCPLAAANAVVKAGKILVGWSRARVELLAARPLQCHRCLEGGHVRTTCTSPTDRSDRCYRCGGAGHRARDCSSPLRCPLCADLGRPAGHRAGSKACAPSRKKGKPGGSKGKGITKAFPPPTAPPKKTPSAQPPPRPSDSVQEPTEEAMETEPERLKERVARRAESPPSSAAPSAKRPRGSQQDWSPDKGNTAAVALEDAHDGQN